MAAATTRPVATSRVVSVPGHAIAQPAATASPTATGTVLSGHAM